MSTTKLLGVRGALSAALLLASIMLVLAATSADAAFPGGDGKIAFSKDNYRQGVSGIFTVAPEGGSQERIGPEFGYSPSWSADGQKLVFVGFSGENERDFTSDIFVMNADGSGLQRVTTGRAYEESPSFFPDGQRIAFVRYTRDSADIYTKTIGVPRATRVTENGGFEESVAVSHDGSKLAFTKFSRRAFSSDIYLMNPDGSQPENLTKTDQTEEFGADWSPDGAKIAFTSIRYSGMQGRVDQEGGAFEPETLGPESLESLARGDSRTKDSVAIPEEDVEVSVINTDGTEREDLTAGRAYDVLPSFSPSGDKIVFSRVTFDGRSERSELVVMDSDGANKEQITDTPRAFEYGADWQPLSN